MDLTTDFECGGGRRLSRIGENHWRVEANGDASGYDKYFCVEVTSGDEPAAVLHLEVHPDSGLGEKGENFFKAHFPSNIWYSDRNWRHWLPLRNTWEDSVTFHDASFELHVPIAPNTRMHIATNPPLRYSDLLEWIGRMEAEHRYRLQRTSLGKSTEGRDIPLLRIPGRSADAPRIFIFAAQHPSEHGGNWACEGIVEYLLSSIAEAREIDERFDIAIAPMINPDGNVHGLSGSNAEGVNMFMDFKGAATGSLPKATEDRLLWDWLVSEFRPDVILHFHGYMGWRRHIHPPYDGIYFLVEAEELYADPLRLAAYRAIQNRLIFETPAYTASWNAGRLSEEAIEHQLAAKLGTLSAFYEINTASVGAFEQFRRGPQVFSALARALLRDTRIFPGHTATKRTW